MKIKFKKTDDTAALPRAALDLEPELSELDLRLIFIIGSRGELDDSELDGLAEALCVTRAEVDISLSYLRGAGILAASRGRTRALATEEKKSDPPKKKLRWEDRAPIYTATEIDKIFASHSELSDLLDQCQNVLGRVFNSTEANTVLVLRDHLKLDAEYILALLAHCAAKDKTSLKYIEKTAFSLYDKGIITPEALEEYLCRKEKADSEEGRIRRLFGMGSRALTEKEEAIFEKWSRWELSFELIEYAYEITVNNTSKPSVHYAAKILENWHEAGYKKPEDVPTADKKSSSDSGGTFDTDDFFESALLRSYGKGGDTK